MLSRTLIRELRDIVGPDGVITDPMELLVYEADGMSLRKSVPSCVVLPRSAEQVSSAAKLLYERGIPFVPRGAGTGLSGGAIALNRAVCIALSRMNRILEIDLANRRALVEAGVANLRLSDAVKSASYHFAPDPSSQIACTIGGNVATNSGGPHTLKYGVTTNHVLGLEMVLPDGTVLWLGGNGEELAGYDLRGLVIGSEGTLGIVTKALVRLVRLPHSWRTMLAVFDNLDDATHAVTEIIAAGIVPAALEMIDSLMIQAVEQASRFGLPLDAAAVLIIELDGLEAGLDDEMNRVMELCKSRRAREIRLARDAKERDQLWKVRKRSIGAIGRITVSYYTRDGTVPRTKLPQVLRAVYSIAERYGLRVGNVFHAGDGNLHPCILFDERDEKQRELVLRAGREMLEACVEAGGTITGEHGVGLEKLELMSVQFTPHELSLMAKVKRAFDPKNLCNPGKVLPETVNA
jgi:glycolate oxidase